MTTAGNTSIQSARCTCWTSYSLGPHNLTGRTELMKYTLLL